MDVKVWVTYRCNLACKYCYESQNKEKLDMSLETAKKTVRFILKQFEKIQNISDQKLRVIFHGGEPLLNYPIITYITHELKNSIPNNTSLLFGTTTNGLIQTNEIIAFLCSNMDKLSVSIDGNSYTHDKYRCFHDGKGSHSYAMQFLMKSLEIRNDICARMTYRSDTVSELFSNVSFLYEKGVKVFDPEPDYGDQNWSEADVIILKNEMKKLKQLMDKDNNVKIIPLLNMDRHIILGKCDGGITSFNIMPNGDIYPCTYIVKNPEFKCGDINTGIKQNIINRIDGMSKIDNCECIGCTHRKSCLSNRCKLMNIAYTGYENQPSAVFCAIEKVMMYIDMLKTEEW